MDSVAITGIGAITAAGLGIHSIVDLMKRGETALTRGAGPWPMGRVGDDDLRWPSGATWADSQKYAGRAAVMAVTAAGMAWEEASGSFATTPEPNRGATIVSVESDLTEHQQLEAVLRETPAGVPLATQIHDELPDFHILRTIPSGVGQMVAQVTGFQGGLTTVGSPSFGGLAALKLAMAWLNSGDVDAVLLAASATLPPPDLHVSLDALSPLAQSIGPELAPFERRRQGGVLGEGAVALVLERPRIAQQRGVPVLGEITSCVTTVGSLRETSLHDVLVSFPTPDFIVAHGASTPADDLREGRALGKRFVAPVTATKSVMGNLGMGSGILDLAVALRCLHGAWVPPVSLLEEPDPNLDELSVVSGQGLADAGTSALVLASMAPWAAGEAGVYLRI